MASRKNPITTHCLDQTTGMPAGGIHVTLELLKPTGKYTEWVATTSASEGRIHSWTPKSPTSVSETHISDLVADKGAHEGCLEFRLTFETLDYWKAKGQSSFYPKVMVDFVVDGQEGRNHWHVPVLLGPWGYTTYRGN